MRKDQVVPYYHRCCEEMDNIYKYLVSSFNGDYAEELCTLRGYVGAEQKAEIKRLNLGRCDVFVESLGDMAKELGFVTKSGNFLLSERYIIPVEDIAGNLVALIGYYPDDRKYITTPSPYFSKECMFFNFRNAYNLSFSKYDGVVVLVEGIFDCISLQAIGLPAIATMGASVSSIKGELLKLFNRVVAIPDGDDTGRQSLDRYGRRGWKVPSNTVMVKLTDIKDMDDMVVYYEADEIVSMILDIAEGSDDYVEV